MSHYRWTSEKRSCCREERLISFRSNEILMVFERLPAWENVSLSFSSSKQWIVTRYDIADVFFFDILAKKIGTKARLLGKSIKYGLKCSTFFVRRVGEIRAAFGGQTSDFEDCHLDC
jgi:hypothetical protein